MSTISAAVLGCGKRGTGKEGWAIGWSHAQGYAECGEEVTLYAVDPNAENLAAFAAQFKLPPERCFASTTQLYAAHVPTLVSICTWPALHRPMVLEAVKAGVKGIACEKPMAMDGSEINEMLDLCRRKQVKLAVAHQRVHEPAFNAMKQLIASGELGHDLCLEFRVGDGWDVLSWTVHWFAMANWMYDAAPSSLLAGVDHRGTRRYQHAVEDASVVFAEYPAEAPAYRQAVFITGPHTATGAMATLRGEAGMASIRKEGLCVWSRKGFEVRPVPKAARSAFGDMLCELIAAVRSNAPMRCDAQQMAQGTRMAFAAHESARTQRAVTLNDTPDFAPLEVLQHPARRDVSLGRVVLLADAHHLDAKTGKSGRDGVADALRSLSPPSLTVIAAEERGLTAGDLADADLLVIYHTQRKSDAATREAMTAWVNAGKPLLVAHCGIGAYSDWSEFRQWIGRYWVWSDENAAAASGHPHEPCDLVAVRGSAFAEELPWSQAWLPRDEVYIRLGQCAPVQELLTAKMGDNECPAAWRSVEQPNVAVFVPGHRWDIWELAAMREGLAATAAVLLRSAAPV